MVSEPISPTERVARWRRRVWSAVQTARTATAFQEASRRETTINRDQLATWGWRALHRGDDTSAKRYFRAALHRDPYDMGAWVGLSRATEVRAERRAYLQAAFDLQYLVTNLERTR